MAHHLAQLNIARLRNPIDAPETRGFVEELEPVNALADEAPGFVWRLQTDEGDATSIRLFEDDPGTLWQRLVQQVEERGVRAPDPGRSTRAVPANARS